MKGPKFIFLFSLSICFSIHSYSSDSLVKAISACKIPIEKIKLINLLCEEVWLKAKYDTANVLVNDAFRLADKELALKPNNKEVLIEKAKAYNNLAIIYRFKGDYSKSLDNHLKALKIRENINDKWGIARSFLGIGTIYEFTGKLDLALEYKFKAKKLFEEANDTTFIAYTLNHIASIYFVQNKIDKAAKYNMESLHLFLKKFNAVGMMDAFTLAGEIYVKQNNFKDAIENYNSALSVMRAYGLKDREISLNVELAQVYYKLKSYDVSNKYLDTALFLCGKTGAKIHFCDIYKLRYMIDSIKSNFKNALSNYQFYVCYKDSLNNQNTSESLTKLQAAYENEKLEKQKQLEALKLEMAHQSQVKVQRTIIYSSILVLILLLMVVFIVLRSSMQRKKANYDLKLKNVIIEKQKKEVDDKQKEILDSISYAQRIQKAHLPTYKYMNRYLSDKK